MNRSRLKIVVPALGLFVVVGLLAALPAAGKPAAAKGTTITVTVGKPSELAFTLSKKASIPAGPVTFKVTNKGAGTHNFEICTTTSKNATANKCPGKGKVTKFLAAGQSDTITVTLTKGLYEFLCTLTGHAAGGMKGILGVATTVSSAAASVGSSSSSTTSGGSSGAECPAGTTIVSAGEDDHDDDEHGAATDNDGCL